MDKLDFRGRWNFLRGKLKEKYAQLTDDDLEYEPGKEQELISRIRQRLGKSREEIDEWIRSIDEGDSARNSRHDTDKEKSDRANRDDRTMPG